MIRRIIITVFLLAFCAQVSAAPIKGAGATSCGSWLKERRNGTYASDLNWILGFISAYNHYINSSSSNKSVFGSVDSEAIGAWMDNYCSSNPLSTPYAGSVVLIEQLRKM